MSKITDWLEIQFWKISLWLIKRGYGAKCEHKDTEEIPEMPKEVNAPQRCACCAANEVADWIKEHIATMQLFL